MEQIYYQERPHTTAAEKHNAALLTAEARRLMAADLARLLGTPPEAGVLWTGTTADLMEAAHTAYTEGCLLHADGQPLTYGQIVERACRQLNVRQPANPRSLARRAEQRKGIRSTTLLDRYRHKLRCGRPDSPMAQCVSTHGL